MVMTQTPGIPASTGHLVVHAEDKDRDVLAQVVADAFHPLAVSEWLITDEEARKQAFPDYFAIYVDHALEAGTVLTTPARDAVALWLPVGKKGPRAPRDYEARLEAVTGPWLSRFQALDTAFEEHHPVGLFHHHLAIIAVRPNRQQAGIGTALLSRHHELLDRSGMPAYLEASDLDKRRIYTQHGYRDYMHGPIELPFDGPYLYPMWRESRRTSDAR
jgi:GNAT superfamily N-acetyltransferase